MSSKLFGQESLMKPVTLAVLKCVTLARCDRSTPEARIQNTMCMWRATAYVQFCSHPVTESFPQSAFLNHWRCTGNTFGHSSSSWRTVSPNALTALVHQLLKSSADFIHASLPSLTSCFVLEIWSRGFVSDQTPTFLFLLENISDSTWHASFLHT